jgi:phospholipase A1
MKPIQRTLISLLLAPSATLAFADDSLERISEEYEALMSRPFVLLPHRDNYIIPVSYNNTPNEEAYEFLTQEYPDRGPYNNKTELEFQISFSVVIAKNMFRSSVDLLGAYTQQSWWQVYNSDWSRQFRESNYNPELFARHVLNPPPSMFGTRAVLLDYGYMHQSNGQVQELSRSWDRLFIRSLLHYKNLIIMPTLWYRIPEGDSEDNNPDITDYLGYGELEISNLSEKHNWRMKLLPGTERLGIEIAYSYPMTEYIRYYLKINYGYGHSLIDYNHKTERIGIGIVLTSWSNL